jgi:very-short-patch-repair endonuclease
MKTQTLNYNGNNIEYLVDQGKPYLHGGNFCNLLGYTNSRSATKNHLLQCSKKFYNINTCQGSQRVTFIEGDSVYELIAHSPTLTTQDKYELLKFLNDNNLSKLTYAIKTRQEIEFICMLERILEPFGFECIRQFKVSGYSVDFFIKNLNIAIEYDENYHKLQKEKDTERENVIVNTIGCRFIRVSIQETHLWNCGFILKQMLLDKGFTNYLK